MQENKIKSLLNNQCKSTKINLKISKTSKKASLYNNYNLNSVYNNSLPTTRDNTIPNELKDLNNKMKNLVSFIKKIEKIRKLVEYSKMTWKVIDEQKKVNALNALKDFQVFAPVMGIDTAVLMERLVGSN